MHVLVDVHHYDHVPEARDRIDGGIPRREGVIGKLRSQPSYGRLGYVRTLVFDAAKIAHQASPVSSPGTDFVDA